jgi:hypothetical protein
MALAPLFGLAPSGVHRAILRGTFPIETYGTGTRRFADPRIVETYFAARRAEQLVALDIMTSASKGGR